MSTRQDAPDWRARVRGSRLGNVLVIAITALAVAIGVWLVNRPAADDQDAGGAVSQVDVDGAVTAPQVGDRAPGFNATALDGSEVQVGNSGRPTWLLFVATWCSGCRAEMPDVQAAHELVGDDVDVVAVYVGETRSVVEPYVGRLGLTFAQVPDSRTEIAAGYGVMGVPAHYFIDAQGVVQHTWVGVLSPDQIDEALATVGG